MSDWSVAQEIAHAGMGRQHVVLLGAGASRAAFPHGEAHGRRLPLMCDFSDIVPVGRALATAQSVAIQNKNFEDIYSELAADEKNDAARQALEEVIFEYFSSLTLPEEPTIYDYLILSLRPKDVIATFNWDPFLIQAAIRNRRITDVPRLMFLHGNVLQGFCQQDNVHGVRGAICSQCRQSFQPVRLLYPVREKNYENDPAIKAARNGVRAAMQNAFMVTVFGYSAPTTDASAIELLRNAWGGWQVRTLEQFEFIDIREEAALITSWEGFVDPVQYHYEIHKDFFESWITKHPRRTGEAWFNQYIEAMFVEYNPVPRTTNLEQLQTWYLPLIQAEKSAGQQ